MEVTSLSHHSRLLLWLCACALLLQPLDATNYAVSIALNAMASQAGVVSGSSSQLVETANTNAVPVNSVSSPVIVNQIASALKVNIAQVSDLQFAQNPDGTLNLDLTLTDLNTDPTVQLGTLSNLTIPLFSGNKSITVNVTTVTPTSTSDTTTIILAVIFSIVGSIVLVGIAYWLHKRHADRKKKKYGIPSAVASVSSSAVAPYPVQAPAKAPGPKKLNVDVQETTMVITPEGVDRAGLRTSVVSVSEQDGAHTFELAEKLHSVNDPRFNRAGLPAQTVTVQQIHVSTAEP